MPTFYLLKGPISSDDSTIVRKINAEGRAEAHAVAYRWMRQLENDFYPDRPIRVIVAELVEILELS